MPVENHRAEADVMALKALVEAAENQASMPRGRPIYIVLQFAVGVAALAIALLIIVGTSAEHLTETLAVLSLVLGIATLGTGIGFMLLRRNEILEINELASQIVPRAERVRLSLDSADESPVNGDELWARFPTEMNVLPFQRIHLCPV
jgi:hypothetical protein